MKTQATLGVLFLSIMPAIAQSIVDEVTYADQKALVYFIRSGAKGGFTFTTTCNNELVGLTRGGDYLHKQVEPGRLEIMTVGGSNFSSLSLVVEKGKVYFVRIYQKPALIFPSVGMKLVEDAWGRKRLEKFSLSAMNANTAVAVNSAN